MSKEIKESLDIIKKIDFIISITRSNRVKDAKIEFVNLLKQTKPKQR